MAESTEFVLEVIGAVAVLWAVSVFIAWAWLHWRDYQFERAERRDLFRRNREAFRAGRRLGLSGKQITSMLRKLEDKGVKVGR